MARTRTLARCTECGRTEPKWVGQCPDCGAWGSMVTEESTGLRASPNHRPRAGSTARAVPIGEVPLAADTRFPTGLGEFDRVLGGGLVTGSVVLLGGEPGAGKSTLLLQAASALAARGIAVLYVSAEESPSQVRLRAERLGAVHPKLLLASETDLDGVLGLIAAHTPGVVMIDSVQTVRFAEGGMAGGVQQVRECAAALVAVAKARGVATVLVGHVTKDGQLAGPRVLEHLVDAVLEMGGDRHHALRLVRATKNRFGSVGEVGCFEMRDAGLVPVEDAGRLFTGDAAPGTAGIALTISQEGRRPLACEVQALVAPSTLTNPRRVASGLDHQRVALLTAVLERRADVKLSSTDIFVASVGGVRLTEPAADLAICLALTSSVREQPVPRDLVVVAEVGLAGELRMVGQLEQRLAEAARLGFRGALLPGAYDGADYGLALVRARDVKEALTVGLSSPR